MVVYLVDPDKPLPQKSKNHFKWVPYPLLKMATWYREQGALVYLLRGRYVPGGPAPDQILVTTSMTYWASSYHNTVHFYRERYPAARIVLGGVYATLHSCGDPEADCSRCAQPCHPKQSGADRVWVGRWKEVDECIPSWDLVSVDYRIVQFSTGCPRRCEFCANWRLAPFTYLTAERARRFVTARKLVIYDDNFLANPHVADILEMLAEVRVPDPLTRRQVVVKCEAQSGFDARILVRRPGLAKAIKRARFVSPRIAWDNGFDDGYATVCEALNLLQDAGYPRKDIQVFMLYNWDLPPEELDRKRVQAGRWGVQVADCRYRPLWALADGYDPWATVQEPEDYYIHSGWSDAHIREFRRACREQNILVRYGRAPDEKYKAWKQSHRGPPRGHSRRCYPSSSPVMVAAGNETARCVNAVRVAGGVQLILPQINI